MCVFSLWSNPLRNALPQRDLLLCCGTAFGRRVCAAVLTISSHSNHKNALLCMAPRIYQHRRAFAKNDDAHLSISFCAKFISAALCAVYFVFSWKFAVLSKSLMKNIYILLNVIFVNHGSFFLVIFPIAYFKLNKIKFFNNTRVPR
jgi:hypothetical protein